MFVRYSNLGNCITGRKLIDEAEEDFKNMEIRRLVYSGSGLSRMEENCNGSQNPQ